MPIRDIAKACLLLTFFLLLHSGTCSAQTVDEASRSYKLHKDYASLELISRHLSMKMSRAAVEGLLGDADYSPVDGQSYYLSDKKDADSRQAVGLVVEYRNKQGRLTAVLQDFWLGEIGE